MLSLFRYHQLTADARFDTGVFPELIGAIPHRDGAEEVAGGDNRLVIRDISHDVGGPGGGGGRADHDAVVIHDPQDSDVGELIDALHHLAEGLLDLLAFLGRSVHEILVDTDAEKYAMHSVDLRWLNYVGRL